MNNNQAHDRLRELFDEDPLEENSSTNPNGFTDEGDQVVGEALSITTLTALSPEAQELLVGLTDTSSSLEPAARERLITAADRGMRRRREEASPLPRLLFVRRRRNNQELDAVAASLSTDRELLSSIERGQVSVEELGPEGVAAWIQLFGLPKRVAIDALRMTFLRADVDQAAAGKPTELSEEQDKFIGEVDDLLQS